MHTLIGLKEVCHEILYLPKYFRFQFWFCQDMLSQSFKAVCLKPGRQNSRLSKSTFFTSNLFFCDRCIKPLNVKETSKDLDFNIAVCSLTLRCDALCGDWLSCGMHTTEINLAVGCTMQSFSKNVKPLMLQCDAHLGYWLCSLMHMHTAEINSAVWCIPQGF